MIIRTLAVFALGYFARCAIEGCASSMAKRPAAPASPPPPPPATTPPTPSSQASPPQPELPASTEEIPKD
jgi:hypothetical protein